MKTNQENYLNSICKKIKCKDKRKRIYEELKTHIEETKKELIKQGIPEEEQKNKQLKKWGIPVK